MARTYMYVCLSVCVGSAVVVDAVNLRWRLSALLVLLVPLVFVSVVVVVIVVVLTRRKSVGQSHSSFVTHSLFRSSPINDLSIPQILPTIRLLFSF